MSSLTTTRQSRPFSPSVLVIGAIMISLQIYLGGMESKCANFVLNNRSSASDTASFSVNNTAHNINSSSSSSSSNLSPALINIDSTKNKTALVTSTSSPNSIIPQQQIATKGATAASELAQPTDATPSPSKAATLPTLKRGSNQTTTNSLLSRNDPLAYRAIRAVIGKDQIDAPAHELKRFENCPVTTQIKVIRSEDGKNWILKSQHYGTPKVVGGDEYFATYTDNSMLPGSHFTAAAFVHDQKDGTYSLDFYESSMNKFPPKLSGHGTLTIHLQYTCHMGLPAHSEKDKWSFGGAINIDFSFPNSTMPPLSKFVQPNSNKAIDLGKYKLVVYHGDSISRQLVNKPMNGGQAKNFKLNAFFHGLGSRSAWNMETYEAMKKLLTGYEQLNREANSAIVLGSAAWDMLMNQRPFNMTSHLQAVQLLIDYAAEVYPHSKIYWRSATALQVHEVAKLSDWHHFESIFYASTLRVHDLYLRQKALIASPHNANVTFLDFYNATYLAADWLEPGDGRHYMRECNKQMIDWFYVTPNDRPVKDQKKPAPR